MIVPVSSPVSQLEMAKPFSGVHRQVALKTNSTICDRFEVSKQGSDCLSIIKWLTTPFRIIWNSIIVYPPWQFADAQLRHYQNKIEGKYYTHSYLLALFREILKVKADLSMNDQEINRRICEIIKNLPKGMPQAIYYSIWISHQRPKSVDPVKFGENFFQKNPCAVRFLKPNPITELIGICALVEEERPGVYLDKLHRLIAREKFLANERKSFLNLRNYIDDRCFYLKVLYNIKTTVDFPSIH